MKNYASLTDVPVYLRETEAGLVLHIILAARPRDEEQIKLYNLHELSKYANAVFSNAKMYEWYDYQAFGNDDGRNSGIVGPIYLNTMKYDRNGCEISVRYDRNGNPENHKKENYAHYISAKISPTMAAKIDKDEFNMADVSITLKPALINNTRMFFVRVRDINIK